MIHIKWISNLIFSYGTKFELEIHIPCVYDDVLFPHVQGVPMSNTDESKTKSTNHNDDKGPGKKQRSH
jgi:hypothetical protein